MSGPVRSSTAPRPPRPAPPPSARRVAAEVVATTVAGELELDHCLDQQLTAATHLSTSDRALAYAIASGTIRHLYWLDHLLLHHMERKRLGNKYHLVWAILRTALFQIKMMRIPAHAAVDAAVAMVKERRERELSGFVNAILRSAAANDPRAIMEAIADPVERLAVEWSHPRWLVERWLASVGEQATLARLRANQQPPQLALLVNPRVMWRDGYLLKLGAVGLSAVPTPLGPHGVLLTDPHPVPTLPGYREGWFLVQDAGAQLIAPLLYPKPGELILDACAAPGGKTAHLVWLRGGGEGITACDRSAPRLRLLDSNLARLKITGVEVVEADAAQPERFPAGMFHKILVDAPCSATGVIRRHPDIKLRRQPEAIVAAAEAQLALLRALAPTARPGGWLLYATCSLEPEENSGVIARFLAEHPVWEPLPFTPQRDGLPAAEITPEGAWRGEPGRSGGDGFFAQRLRKRRG